MPLPDGGAAEALHEQATRETFADNAVLAIDGVRPGVSKQSSPASAVPVVASDQVDLPRCRHWPACAARVAVSVATFGCRFSFRQSAI